MVTTTALPPHVLAIRYSGKQMLGRARAAGIFEFLRKPLQREDIAECFGRVLRSLEPRNLVQS